MKWNLRTAALAVLALIAVRLLCSWTLGSRLEIFSQPELATFLTQEKTGQLQQLPQSTEPPVVSTQPPTEPPTQPPTEPPTEPPTLPPIPEDSAAFYAPDVDFVTMNYSAKRQPDLEELLTQSLDWDLTGDTPRVLIFHSHGTEAFTPEAGESYKEEGGEYRTTNEDYNMISLGAELVRLLGEAGITAVHDTTYYDYPDYLASYDNARIGLQQQLKKYPTVKLVIDLHRDAAEYENGSQWATEAMINGEKSAQIMMVIGTDSYYNHPGWEKNLSVALKLHTLMEKTHPGVTRPLDLRKQRFNQDLLPGTVMAEIGAAGNTHREAMNTVSVLAEAIIYLSKGANT